MFDVAFSELVVIAVIALIVIGPEKLPKVARTLGSLAGRLQRYMADVKADVERELRFEDLQKLQQEIRQNAEQASATISRHIEDAENSIGNTIASVDNPALRADESQDTATEKLADNKTDKLQ